MIYYSKTLQHQILEIVKYINCVSKEVYELGENAFLMKKYVRISQLK